MENEVQSNSTSQAQVGSQKKVSKTPKQKFWITVGLTALIVLLLGTNGYLTYRNYQLKQKVAQKQPTPKPLPEVTKQAKILSPIPTKKQTSESESSLDYDGGISPKPTIGQTSDWKTYTNSYGKYLLKYPEDWVLQNSTDAESALDNPTPNNVLGSELKYRDSKNFNNRVSITVNKVSSQNNLAKAKNVLLSWGGNEAMVEDVTLDGVRGYKLTWTYSDPASSESRIDYRFENNGLLYRIELSVNDKTPTKKTVYHEAKKILSTLEFTN